MPKNKSKLVGPTVKKKKKNSKTENCGSLRGLSDFGLIITIGPEKPKQNGEEEKSRERKKV